MRKFVYNSFQKKINCKLQKFEKINIFNNCDVFDVHFKYAYSLEIIEFCNSSPGKINLFGLTENNNITLQFLTKFFKRRMYSKCYF